MKVLPQALLALSCGALFLANAPARAEELKPIVRTWLQNQTNIQTWSADVTQIRNLKALTQPLMATGQVWFAAPNRFRWEIGYPPKTIALRQTNQMLVIYPPLKRVERYPLGDASTGPWKETLALLEAGFPRDAAAIESRFRVVGQGVTNGVFQLSLEPKSPAARRMMPMVRIAFGTNDLVLKATELQFTDGSTMRNEFRDPRLNPKIDPAVFQPEIAKDYQIVEPLKR